MFDAFVGLVPLPRIRPTFFTPTTPGAWIFYPLEPKRSPP